MDENSIAKTLKPYSCLGMGFHVSFFVVAVVVAVVIQNLMFIYMCTFRLIHMELNDFVKASECFQICIKSNSSFHWIRYHLVLSLARQGWVLPCVVLCFFFIFLTIVFAHHHHQVIIQTLPNKSKDCYERTQITSKPCFCVLI